MPCYEVRTVSVEFKVENIDLLKKAVVKAGWSIKGENDNTLSLKKEGGGYYSDRVFINLNTGKISSQSYSTSELAKVSNSLKRAYSEQVIDEVAKRQKWQLRKMRERKFQLQRY